MNIHPERFTVNRKRFVKLPAAEFDALMDALRDAEDAKSAKAVSARIKAGEETFPIEFVEALAKTEHAGQRIAAWRRFRGITAKQLTEIMSDESTLYTRNQLTMIETGKRRGSIGLFMAAAAALRCDMADLI